MFATFERINPTLLEVLYMSSAVQAQVEWLNDADKLVQWSNQILRNAPLTDIQKEDMQAIYDAAYRFQTFAHSELQIIYTSNAAPELQRVRHQLRNYLNVIIGFSRLLTRELADNLLMDMITIRKIHHTGEALMAQIEAIR